VLVDAGNLAFGCFGVEGDDSLVGADCKGWHILAPLDETTAVLGVAAFNGGLLAQRHVPHRDLLLVVLQDGQGLSIRVPVDVDNLVFGVASQLPSFVSFLVLYVDVIY